MTKKYEVHYGLSGSLVIEADSSEEAKEVLMSSDYTSTDRLILGFETNILDVGNDAIIVSDVVKLDEIDDK